MINFCLDRIVIRKYCVNLHLESSAPVCRWSPRAPSLVGWLYGGDGRKVRAAKDTPLPKVEAVGDSGCR